MRLYFNSKLTLHYWQISNLIELRTISIQLFYAALFEIPILLVGTLIFV